MLASVGRLAVKLPSAYHAAAGKGNVFPRLRPMKQRDKFHAVLRLLSAATLAFWLAAGNLAADEAKPLRLLFLGDHGHHRPAERFTQLQPALARRGIELDYSDRVESLDPRALASYAGLVIYANTTEISPEQERALLEFIESGHGLVALHCASYCFLNSQKYVDLVGAQFLRHGTGTFRTTIVAPDHPIMRGFDGFAGWDETYVHTKHNTKDRTVLEVRAEGDTSEPWTWVRTQGRGRVFYTAWGHDERTWGKRGFQNLVERGIRWATGGDPAAAGAYHDDAAFPLPQMTPKRTDVRPFEYVDVGPKIPRYVPGKKWGAQEQPANLMQKPLEPAESLKHLIVPEGFHVELFAAEPQLGGKPIAMTWDERGRLYVAETVDYPNELKTQGQGRDRIRICEDTDGDGSADRFTVFAEGLSIPTSMLVARGGLIVFDATQTVFLRDTDGDDVADQRTVLFGDWALGDTHGGPSNMQYGLDNWIWAMQGYNRSKLVVGGQTHEFRQGFFRFRSDGSKLEFIRSTDNNTWGLGISEEGIVFGSTANHNPSVYMPIANRYYEAVRGWTPSLVLPTIAESHLFHAATDKVRQVDHFGGYTAGAGHALYTARRYPREYWNRTAFVCEPTGHLVGTFVLVREGAGFRSSNPFNLLASDDEWTAPIMAEVGPDGNVWVIDWYNYIVQHNPTPDGFKTGKGAAYESELRDKRHGRIYRVVYDGPGDGQQRSARRSLAGAAPDQLVAALRDDNLFWRRHAQRLLVERGGRDVVPALIELVRDTGSDAIGLNVGAIHALWTLHGLGALDGSNSEATRAALAALRHPSAGVRRNALAVLPRTAESIDAIVDGRLTRDDDAQVRLAALLALADGPTSGKAAASVIDALIDAATADDRWLVEAATCAAARNSGEFLEQLVAIEKPGAKLIETARIVAGHQVRTQPADVAAALVPRLASADPALAEAIVEGLAGGWPKDRPPRLTAELEQSLPRLAPRLSTGPRGALVRMAVLWKSHALNAAAAALAQSLVGRLVDEGLAAEARIEAARELLAFRPSDAEAAVAVLDAVTPRMRVDLATALVSTLKASDAKGTARAILDRLARWTPAVRSAAVGVMLSRAAWSSLLVDEAERGNLSAADLTLEERQALLEHPDKELRRRARDVLARRGALPSADRKQVLDEFRSVAERSGDAVAGKVVFTKHCSKCHVHGALGQRIGPDLTGMAVHTKAELLANILDPSRSVEGNFRVFTLTTVDGKVLTGLLASESQTALELFDSEGRKTIIARSDVDELVASTKSLMPEGFEKQLSRGELADLLEFLTERGRYVPLPLDKAATATSTRGMFYRYDATVERLVFDSWEPKQFRGVPFQLVDPTGDRRHNVVLLFGPQGDVSAKMPKSASVACNLPAKAIHLLGGISGWGYPLGTKGSVSLIVRLHYADGQSEDHELRNGEHLADYIRRVDVSGSQFAFDLDGRQLRYLAINPRRPEKIERIELVKGPDATAPVVMAITIETAE